MSTILNPQIFSLRRNFNLQVNLGYDLHIQIRTPHEYCRGATTKDKNSDFSKVCSMMRLSRGSTMPCWWHGSSQWVVDLSVLCDCDPHQ
jgi:hypothetical protein